jgi:hypothetical protein
MCESIKWHEECGTVETWRIGTFDPSIYPLLAKMPLEVWRDYGKRPDPPTGDEMAYFAQELERDMQWQAIATAPKDGRDILVGYDFASVWVVHVAFWRDCDAFNDPLPAGHDGIGWWSYIADSVTQTKLNNDNAPTHWMPLPKLPNE